MCCGKCDVCVCVDVKWYHNCAIVSNNNDDDIIPATAAIDPSSLEKTKRL